MPVRKYRSVEEMSGPPPVEPGSPDHWARVAIVWRRGWLLANRERVPGVYRYRAVDDPARIEANNRVSSA
jgi:hypothetical protein